MDTDTRTVTGMGGPHPDQSSPSRRERSETGMRPQSDTKIFDFDVNNGELSRRGTLPETLRGGREFGKVRQTAKNLG